MTLAHRKFIKRPFIHYRSLFSYPCHSCLFVSWALISYYSHMRCHTSICFLYLRINWIWVDLWCLFMSSAFWCYFFYPLHVSFLYALYYYMLLSHWILSWWKDFLSVWQLYCLVLVYRKKTKRISCLWSNCSNIKTVLWQS